MIKYKEIKGNLITLAKEGEFDVITHGCNCFCAMGAGLAPQMATAFGCDKFRGEGNAYMGTMNKLGTIEGRQLTIMTVRGTVHELNVVNSYTQYEPGRNVDYNALVLCLKKINKAYKGKTIGLPMIGCGIAGGDWKVVKPLIQEVLTDMYVVVVKYDKN